jgi:membrane-associated protease RseP (regulator of RpoE activity)
MITDFWKATTLALLMLVPSANAARAEDDPKIEKKIVIEEDGSPDARVVRRAQRGYLGIQLIEITPELRAHYGVARDAGVLVGSVEPDSPAAKAGIEVGDIITRAGGERLESVRDLTRMVRDKKTGDTLKIEVSRNRATKSLTATVAERTVRHEQAWTMPDLSELEHVRPMLSQLEHSRSLQDRLDQIEKRLDDLEKRRSAR